MSATASTSAPPRRLIYLEPEAVSLCQQWNTITELAHVTGSLLDNTRNLLIDLALQRDQSTSITNTRITELRQELNAAIEGETTALATIQDLRTQLAARDATIAALNRIAIIAPAPVQQEKIPRPEKFDGNQSQLSTFIMQLRLYTATFPDEQSKLRAAVLCLTGDAMDQARIYIQDERVNLANLAAFITVMENAFGNPNRVAEAEHKLRTITQGTRDFSTYHAEFQRYASEVTWDEASLWSHLRNGLTYELKRLLITVRPPPANMTDFITTCHDIDTQHRQLKSESHRPHQQQQQQQQRRPAPAPRAQVATAASTAAATASTASGTAPGPMDLSATRRRISPEEKARRMAEGRCYRCGGLGHMVMNCPLGLRASLGFLAPAPASPPVPPPEIAAATAPEEQGFQ